MIRNGGIKNEKEYSIRYILAKFLNFKCYQMQTEIRQQRKIRKLPTEQIKGEMSNKIINHPRKY